MGDKIYVPYQEAESEFVEKRSRFIGHIWPVDSEDQAQELIRRVKKQHYDARHNCWCYLLGGSVVRYSDDGEPQGTAGPGPGVIDIVIHHHHLPPVRA